MKQQDGECSVHCEHLHGSLAGQDRNGRRKLLPGPLNFPMVLAKMFGYFRREYVF